MRKVLPLLLFILASIVFAEHDATYCGRLIPGDKGKSWGGHPAAILIVGYQVLVSTWPDTYEDVDGYAAINAINSEIADRNLEKFLKTARPTTRICVKGRWGGSLYSSSDINDISLASDSVDRIDYASKFDEED